jgi:antitoxin (DNA-binding transcriptional repressor) of toxin-antitoxin stability system
MWHKMRDSMVKASVRAVEKKWGKYFKMAHEGQEIVITKRGIPWARLRPAPHVKGTMKSRKTA